ncbi:MAG: hypothetical protein GX100_07935 [candidate division WS1 bacterium]|nr:hypothetical protein [candidate division WS1 bacterium]
MSTRKGPQVMAISAALITTAQSPRIERFAAASRERGLNQSPNEYPRLLMEAWERHADKPSRERQARARAEALEHMPVYLFPDEHLVGMIHHQGPTPVIEDPLDYYEPAERRTANELPQNAELVELNVMSGGGAPGHVAWRWDWILERGVLGILEEYREAQKHPRDETAAEFYQGVILGLEAVLHWNARHCAALEEALAAAPYEEQERLAKLLEICQRVPAHPARTFHEAVQSYWFQHLCVMREEPYGGNSPGRLDYFLWPYLERDLAAGHGDMHYARELVDELLIRINERVFVSDGHVESAVIGGSHPDGTSSVNPLSYLLVESFTALDQTHPSIYLRIPEQEDLAFLEMAAGYLRTGNNRAQILSDKNIVPAMCNYGMPIEDARMYICGGCMEINPHGMNSDLLWTGTYNVPKALELCLTGGECLRTGQRLQRVELKPLSGYDRFEDFYAAFRTEMQRQLTTFFKRLDLVSETMAEYRPAYLLSSLILDCRERGREQQDGGARYHDYGATPMGIPNAADALYALKRAVYDEHWLTAEELLTAIRADFKGYESLRQRLRNLPKFGQQHPEADAMADRLLGDICDIFAGYRTRWGGRAKAIIFTFVWASSAGGHLGATADGQFAGKPIAHGLTPQAAGMSEGLTAAIGSHASLCLGRVAGAASSMWDLDPDWANPELVASVLKSFVEMGGQIFQGNMTDVQDLIEAQERPEDHFNLFVRVGGFSARFVNLDPQVQNEIIGRYRHRG